MSDNSMENNESGGDSPSSVDSNSKQEYEPEEVETTQQGTDSAKLFIGQLPKTMSESELRLIFEPFGRIVDFTLIQDRQSGTHRGCGFLTYDNRQEAESAMSSLHDKKTFPPAKHPIQIRWAIGEAERSEKEHKLFVGNLPKGLDDDAVKVLFTQYGELESVNVLRHPTSESRGCAFVKYKTREEALNGINGLNGYKIDEGHVLIVKFAENEQAKRSRKALQAAKHMGAYGAGFPGMMPGYPGGYGYPGYNGSPFGYPGQANPYMANYPGYYQQQQQQAQQGSEGQTGFANPTPFAGPAPGGYPQAQDPPFVEGPQNANLFVYHLPQHIGMNELSILFSTYGNVLSTKVFYDRASGQSKGYGFVSYDNPESASTAIATLNGYSIANKRLKVSLKTKKDRFQPY